MMAEHSTCDSYERKSFEIPLVSVIIPVFNLGDSIGTCLESLRNQSCSDFEVVCVDDCSTDETASILERYGALDERIVTHTLTQNSGASVARNTGVDCSRGRFITFVDGDDFVSPYYLEALLEAYAVGGDGCFVKAANVRGPAESVGSITWSKPTSEDIHVFSSYEAVRDYLLERLSVVSWACLAPRSWYLEHRFRDMIFEDHYLTIDCLLSASCVVTIREPLYAYVRRDVSLSNPVIHDIRFPRDMCTVAEHIQSCSKEWSGDFVEATAWAVAWRLALAVSFCSDIDTSDEAAKREVNNIGAYAVECIRMNLLSVIRAWCHENLDNKRLVKILIAASSPKLYWGLRKRYRALTVH